jgi:hypothetical protein
MTTYPVWTAGQKVTAAMLAGMQRNWVNQGADLVVNNSTTLQNTSLIVPMLANGIYEYLIQGWVRASATADVKFNWSLPAGATVDRNMWGAATGATGGTTAYTESMFRVNSGGDIEVGAVSTSTTSAYYEYGLIRCGGTAGNATLQFAQFVANASDATFRAQSNLFYTRVG